MLELSHPSIDVNDKTHSTHLSTSIGEKHLPRPPENLKNAAPVWITPEETIDVPINQQKYSPLKIVNSSSADDDPADTTGDSTSLYPATCLQKDATRSEVSSPSTVVNTRPEDDRASTGDQLCQSSIDTLTPHHISSVSTVK